MKRKRGYYRVMCLEDDGIKRAVTDFRQFPEALAYCVKNNQASQYIGLMRRYYILKKKIYKKV